MSWLPLRAAGRVARPPTLAAPAPPTPPPPARPRARSRRIRRPRSPAPASLHRQPGYRLVLAVPRGRSLQPLTQLNLRAEPQLAIRLRNVEQAAGLPLRLAIVPDDAAFEAGHLGQRLRHAPYAGLHARGDVHQFGGVVALPGQEHSPGDIGGVDEVPRRLSAAPG